MTLPRANPERLAALSAAAAVVLSALALGLSAHGESRLLTMPFAGVAWAVLAVWAVRDLRDPGRSGASSIGRDVGAQLLLTVALGLTYVVALGPGLGQGRAVVWAAIVVLLCCTAIEPVLHQLQPGPDAAGLAGIDPVPGAPLARWVHPITLALLGLEFVVALTLAPPLWWLLIAVVQAVLTAVAGLGAAQAHRTRGRRAAALHRSVEAHAPVFALYTARRNGAYQLRMWLPYLQELGLPFLVVTRDPAAILPLRAVTDSPVVARPSWRELDDVVVPSLRAAFYVNSVAANSDFVTYRRLRHIYLGHGESDKALSAHPAHAMYDTIVVAGQAAIDRYRRAGVLIPPSKLVVAGRPQVSAVDVATVPISTIALPAVLYAPTWAGYNQESSYSSLPVSVEVVQALLRRPGAVIFRPHPLSRERAAEQAWITPVEELLRADAARTGRPHRFGADVDRLSFAECANLSDAMVTDLSSVLVDYFHSEKPVAVVAMPGTGAGLRARHLATQAAYLLDPHDAEETLEELLGGDPLAPARRRARQYFLGEDTTGEDTAGEDTAGEDTVGRESGARDPAQRFVSVLRRLIDAGPVEGHPASPTRQAAHEESR